MAAIITNIIPKSNFELVREKIGVILLEELTNQKVLQEDDFPEDVNVYSERITPIDNAEQIIVNVLLDSANYGNFTEKDSQGRTIFYIDLYTTGQASDDKSGSLDSSERLQRFLRMCRYILASTLYNTLGFDPGFIGGTYVENFQILDPAQKEDSAFTRFARIQFAVRIQENQDMWEGVLITGADTQVKLQLTDKGYKYIFSTT